MANDVEWKILKANPETQRAQLNRVLEDIESRLDKTTSTALAAKNTGATLSTAINDPTKGLKASATAINYTNANVTSLEGVTTAIAEDVTSLSTRVDDLDLETTGLSTALDVLTTRVTTAEGEIDAVASDVVALETAVYNPTTGLAATSNAVNTLESRVTVNEGTISSTASDVTALDGRISTAETDINNIETVNTSQGSAISGLDVRLTSAEGTISSHSSSLTSLDSRVSTTETDINSIESVNAGQATAISGLDTRVTTAEGNITSTSNSLTTLTSRVDTAESDINAIETVNSGQATAISGLDTRVTSAEGTITAHASAITQLETDVDGNTAAITTEQNARSTADSALANDHEMLAVQLRGSYEGSDLASVTTGLIAQEKAARVAEDEAIATQLTLLSVGVGEQFDYAEIWYFSSGVDGWTGPTTAPTAAASWLRPADGTADTRVYSPDALNVVGTEYPQLRMRVRKTGTPTWDGSFAWKDGAGVWSAVNTLTEPSWDSDNIGVVTESVAWSAEVDQIWMELATNQTATDYYEIDWVAIGRPAPGASSAALSEELAVRAAADASEVTARELLSTKLIGTTDPTGLTIETVTSGLIYDERQARSTADSAMASDITSLESTVNDPSTGVAANASGLSSLTTRVTTAEGDIDSIVSDVTALETSVAGKASAAAVDSLTTRVTTAEGEIDANTADITSLETTVNDPSTGVSANASGLSSLTTRVTTAEGTISAHSSDITALETTVNDPSIGVNATASALSSLDTEVGDITGAGFTSAAAALTDLVARVDTAEASIAQEMITRADEDTALAAVTTALDSRLTDAETDIVGQAGALSSLTTRVTDTESDITVISTDVVDLSARIDSVEAPSPNMLTNPTAAVNTSGWSGTTAISRFVRNDKGTGFTSTLQTVAATRVWHTDTAVTLAGEYSLSAEMYLSPDTTGTTVLDVLCLDSGGAILSDEAGVVFPPGTADGWTGRLGFTFTAPAGTATIRSRVSNTGTYTQIIWQRVKLETGTPTPYSNEAAYTADAGAIASLTTRVNDTGGGKSIEVVASDLVSLTAEVDDPSTGLAATGAALNSLETTVGTFPVGGHTSAASALTELQGDVYDAATGLGATFSAVSTLEGDVATLDGTVSANVAAITGIETSLTGSGNLAKNAEFANKDITGWTASGTYTTLYVFDSASAVVPVDTIAIVLSTPAGMPVGSTATVKSDPIEVEAGKNYIGSMSVGYQNRATSVVMLRFYDRAGVLLSGGAFTGNTLTHTGGGGTDLSDLVVSSTGNVVAPANSAYAELWMRATGIAGSGASRVDFTRPMLERVGVSQSDPSPWMPGIKDRASVSAVESMEVDLDALRATHTIELDVNGYISGLESVNTGTTSSFSVLADVFRVIQPAGTAGLTWEDGILWNKGTTHSVILGQSFGASEDLQMWAGPNPSSPSTASKANAVFWLDNNGNGFFSGALQSGQLKFSATGTATTSTAEVVLGPFNTNGGSKSVDAKYFYSQRGWLDGDVAATYDGQAWSASGVLERSPDNVTWTQFGVWAANGTRAAEYDPESTSTLISTVVTDTDTVVDSYATADTAYYQRMKITARSAVLNLYDNRETTGSVAHTPVQELTITSTEG